jgi:hypothetical protein
MSFQFRTLTFYSRPEEQLQECPRLKKSVTLLPAVIMALDSPLGPHPESDLSTNLYFGFTPIANIDESDHWIIVNNFKESLISLSAAIEALGFPLGPHLERDLATDLYAGSTLIAIIDESGRQIKFNSLNKSVISLSAAIRALGSPVGSHLESDIDGSILWLYPDSYQNESNRQISFRQLQESYIITIRGDQGIGLSSRILFKNRSCYKSILWLCPSSQL